MKNYTIGLWSLLCLVIGYFCYHAVIDWDTSLIRQAMIVIEPRQKIIHDIQDDQVGQDVSLSEQKPHDVFEDLIQGSPDHRIEQSQALYVNTAIIPEVDYTEHSFKELNKKKFYTLDERLAFFAELGIEYLNQIVFDYQPALDVDVKQSEKYQNDMQEHELLTKLYGLDIANHALIPLSIRWINKEIGHGVFAEIDVPKKGFIGVYGGLVKDRALVINRDYAWAYPGETLQGGRLTLDAATHGNELRLINDGKEPNCIVKYIVGLDGFWHVCYVAAKDIKKGDQLLISYGPSYWDTRKYKYQELVHA